MMIMALDLEMNQPPAKLEHPIIQVGAAVGDTDTRRIVDAVNCVINTGEKIDPFIQNLTGINDELVSRGWMLEEAWEKLHECFFINNCVRTMFTWGGDDHLTLAYGLGIDIRDCFFDRDHIDVGYIHKMFLLSKRVEYSKLSGGGLAGAVEYHNMEFTGRTHNALHDAINTLRVYFKLLDHMPPVDHRLEHTFTYRP